MEKEYPLTELEYAKMLGLSKEGVRSRRRQGKLDGLFIQKDNRYFYERVRPNQVKTAPKNRTRNRRRGAHKSLGVVRYPNNAFRNHNELKMLAKLKYNLDDETLSLFPEALAKAKEAKAERIKEVQSSVRVQSKGNSKNYCSGLYTPGTRGSRWKSLTEPVAPKKKYLYY